MTSLSICDLLHRGTQGDLLHFYLMGIIFVFFEMLELTPAVLSFNKQKHAFYVHIDFGICLLHPEPIFCWAVCLK